jgi:type I restriction-modification system DNA methylase subunit
MNSSLCSRPLMVTRDIIRVFDPAAGCGNFLLAASEFAAAHGTEVKLYGADTDQTAIDICRLVSPGAELHCGDALRDLPWKNRFDAVIGNPPYVFTRSGSMSAVDKASYASRYRCGRGRISLPALFLERGIELLRQGGRLGYVIPSTLLRAADFDRLRRIVLETCRIVEIRLLGARVFPGVTGEIATVVLQRERTRKRAGAADVRIIQQWSESDLKAVRIGTKANICNYPRVWFARLSDTK